MVWYVTGANPTHRVLNQPPPLLDDDLYQGDPVLDTLLRHHEADHHVVDLAGFGRRAGTAEHRRHGELANRHEPVLHTHDRFGHRIDEVEFHPSWHHLMAASMETGMQSVCWNSRAGWVARCAYNYLDSQIEAGHWCPISMTGAAVATLGDAFPAWTRRLTASQYQPTSAPIGSKPSALCGMGMTEKQGGSDVRANTTRAERIDSGGGDGDGWFRITGHKWFTSAPTSDGFLVLARTGSGLSCFLMPRVLDDGSRNAIRIVRLKDKLGNRSNASAEVEFDGALAQLVGEEGRGVATILPMVSVTRLDCAASSAALMRQAVTQARHHVRHREAFGSALIDKPLMRNVIADLEIEARAALAMTMSVATTFDHDDEESTSIRRILTPLAKYWITKRCTGVVREAMECLGGNGYVEESGMPRLFRESPVNAIWEGSGNVIALDVLRVLAREPHAVELLLDRAELLRSVGGGVGEYLDGVAEGIRSPGEATARVLTERLALVAQTLALTALDDPQLVEAFVRSRLLGESGNFYGTLPADLVMDRLVEST
jgi:putative acyl-CoA dehydrogenase